MPLDPKLTKFTTTSPILASFDFVDVADGTGVIEFFAASVTNNTTADHYLTRNTVWSDEIYTVGSSSVESFVQVLDLDFDVTFQLSRTIAKGIMYAVLSMGVGTTGSLGHSMYAIVKLRKVGDSGEVEIANARTRTISSPSSAADQPFSDMFAVSIPITEEVHFSGGDILRVTVEVWGKQTGGGSVGQFALGHDPKNRNDPRSGAGEAKIFEDDDDTITKFYIPFVIDV